LPDVSAVTLRGAGSGRALDVALLVRAVTLVAVVALAIGWTLALGKDVHWDAINYHLYLGFSALHDRFAQDFFAAGPPAYLNPYAYVPLYLAVAAGWSAWAIAAALAAWHSLTLWLTYEIALVAGAPRPARVHIAFALLAVAFAATNPVLLQVLGSTTADLTTAVFVLGGWWCVAVAVRDGRASLACLAGVLVGAAAAMKLSNAVFAMAAVPALLFVEGTPQRRVLVQLGFGLACGIAFLAAAMPWGAQLWREFGNPFFPFLNEVFRSPDFTTEALRYERFMPSGIIAFLARPLEMISAASHVHTEPRAPDLRYAVLLIALVVAALIQRRRASAESVSSREEGATRRVGQALLVGLVVSWVLWLLISGNSRYFIPMGCIAAVLLATTLQGLYVRWQNATLSVIVLVFTVQGVQFWLGTDWQRDGGPWQGPWLRIEVPERLRSEPSLHLSVGFLSGSAFLPHFHPASGMINVGGFNVITPGYSGAIRAQALIDRNESRLRILTPLPPGVVDRSTLPGPPEQLGVHVRRLGVKVDGSDCEFLRMQGNLRGERSARDGTEWKYFLSCRLVKAPEERIAYLQAVAAVDVAFDRIEDACPKLFQPRRAPTQEYLFLARTYHMGSEMQLYVDGGRVKYFYPLRGGDPIDVGPLDAWRQAPQRIDCSVRTQPAFQKRADG
jgi:hypothetical protein